MITFKIAPWYCDGVSPHIQVDNHAFMCTSRQNIYWMSHYYTMYTHQFSVDGWIDMNRYDKLKQNLRIINNNKNIL